MAVGAAGDGLYAQGAVFTLGLLGFGLAPGLLPLGRLWRFYGQMSYSVYLWHAPIVYALSPVFTAIYAREEFPVTVRFAACLGAVLAIVTPLAFASFHLVERPGVRLGHYVFRRISAPSQQGRTMPAS